MLTLIRPNIYTPPALITGKLTIGQRVHCILYGGKDGSVYNISGDQKPETVKTLGGFIHTGGNAEFDIVWDNGTLSNRTPESIIHGVQWRIYDELSTPEAIISALEAVQVETTRREVDKTDKTTKRAEARELLKIEYPYLIVNPGSGGVSAAKNIRIELKRAWPKIKFSVRSEHSSINVSWTDGPTCSQVDVIINKYKAGSFDGMTDCYEYSSSAFNDLFGDAHYIFSRRDISDELFNRAFAMLKAQYPGNIAADLVCTNKEWIDGKLWNISMNTGGDSHRDNVQQYMNGVTNLLPAIGYEYKHQITKTGDTFKLHCFDYSYGTWHDYEETALDHCLKQIEWNFWNRI